MQRGKPVVTSTDEIKSSSSAIQSQLHIEGKATKEPVTIDNVEIKGIFPGQRLPDNNTILREPANLFVHPGACNEYKPDPTNQLTIGDMHGNALKFLHFLIRHHVVEDMSADDYDAFVRIYCMSVEELTVEQIKKFKELVSNLKINTQAGFVRLIGDELADRGTNDYFTLKLIEALSTKKLPMEIILSNHSLEFIKSYELKHRGFSHSTLMRMHVPSMLALHETLNKPDLKELDLHGEVNGIINEHYKSKLQALDYSISPDKKNITIYSHAAIGLADIQALTEQLNIKFDDSTIDKLAQTIDNINIQFRKLVKLNQVHTLAPDDEVNAGYADRGEALTAFIKLLWNRSYYSIHRPSKNKGYTMNWVHGHDSNDRDTKNNFNLDNDLGRTRTTHYFSAPSKVLLSRETPSALQLQIIQQNAAAVVVVAPGAAQSASSKVTTKTAPGMKAGVPKTSQMWKAASPKKSVNDPALVLEQVESKVAQVRV